MVTIKDPNIKKLYNIVEKERESSERELLNKTPKYTSKVISFGGAIVLYIYDEAFFDVGDSIDYLLDGSATIRIELGTVIDYNKGSKMLTLLPSIPSMTPELEIGKEVEIIESEVLIGYDVQKEILEEIDEGKISSSCLPLIFGNKKLGELSRECKLLDDKTVDGKDKLDESQKEAVEYTLSLKDGDILLVVGPPGTGKTEFIAKASLELCKRGEKILIASHTNRAVDNAIGKLPVDETLRIGKPEKVLPEISKYLLSYKSKQKAGDKLKEIDEEIERIKEGIKELSSKSKDSEKEHEELEKANDRLSELWYNRNNLLKKTSEELVKKVGIIGSTLIKSQLYPLNRVEFDTVFIDESSIATIPLALLSLLKGKKYVLVGDHNQLLPILRSVKSDAEKERLSSFSFLVKKHENRVCWLRNHYRSNSKIIGFSQKYVYDGKISPDKNCDNIKLEIDSSIYERIKDERKELLDPNKPVIFVHIEGLEEGKSSKYNKDEAEVCEEILKLFVNAGIRERDIGIITPYVDQRKEISDLITNKSELIINKKDLEINTVDSFQGRQKEVMIISLVSQGRSMRFVSEPHRLNVALTRAISKLIVIGNGRAIYESNYLIGRFLEYVYGNGNIYGWKEEKWLN